MSKENEPIPVWIERARDQILLNDYSYLDSDQILEALCINRDFITQLARTDLKVLVDVRGEAGIRADKRVLAEFKTTALALKPFIARAAVVGLTPIQQSFLNFISTISKIPIRSFVSKDEALNWLVDVKEA